MAVPDGFIPIKPEKIVEVGLGLLERETMLAQTVWRDAAGDFRGVKGDTISIRLPAYAVANKRALRSADARVRSTLFERKVDVSLTHDLQVDIPLTDEEITLDIRDFTREITGPATTAIVRAYEEEVADLMSNATYETSIEFDNDDPYATFVDARTALNDASVPQNGRFAVVGTNLENIILKVPELRKVNEAGTDSALRDATIGRLAGFQVLVSNFLPPDEGYCYHRSAYVLNTRAPFIPQGAAWGASMSKGGFAIRVLQHLDAAAAAGPINVVFHDAWVGSSVVEDAGALNSDGKFVPHIEPNPNGGDTIFVRSVQLVNENT